ncbi:hypothetical protein N1851_015373 [Merluccius polli]|uniref:Uncharacterized protein n=1 Tax=Merluccius polli TaxID=89951 RepID=A0AA47P2U6_MERPO|nr:hypothetical protein N1851_015373 [Merluccius polli]
MTDEELREYIEQYGDRLAIRAMCRQKTVKSRGVETVRSSLMQKVRERLGEQHGKTPANREEGPIGNQNAVKDNRRVEIGWLHSEDGTFHQVKTKKGGGTRHFSVQKSITMGDLLETGKGLFFPNGQSSKGPMANFNFDIRDYSHKAVPPEVTVGQLYEQTKLRMLRVYTTTKAKDVTPVSDALSDFEPQEESPMKVIFCHVSI